MFDIHKLVKSFKEADKVKQEFRDYLKELGPIFFDNVHDEIPYLDADDLDFEITEDWENIYFSQRRVNYDEDDTFTYTIPIAALESLETFKEWCTGEDARRAMREELQMKQEEIARLKKNKKEFDRLKDQLEHIGDWYQCLSCGWTSVYERKPDGNRENKCPECHKNNMENMQGTEMEYWENYGKKAF